MPMPPFERVAAALPVWFAFSRGLRSVLRLTLTAWHIARGVVIVATQFPSQDAGQRQVLVQCWSSDVLRALGVDVQVRGSLEPGAKLLVANHVSWLDVIVLQSLCPQVRFVAKAEVGRWPLIGRLVVGARTFFVERDRPRKTRTLVDALAVALSAGETVVVFPEGTTSDGHAVLPFRTSLLHAALIAAVPVQPLALRYADAHHAVSRRAPYIDDDTLLGSFWRTARAEGLVVSVQALAAQGPAAGHRRPLAAALRLAIQESLDAGPLALPAERANGPAAAHAGHGAALPNGDS